MKPEEQIAHDYMKACGHQSIVYEPHGNRPPDFAVDSTIGVEVRRLNQSHFRGTKTKGLEVDEYRLTGAVESVLREFDRSRSVKAYRVSLSFSRPLGDLPRVKDKIRAALTTFLQSSRPTPREMRITPSLSLTVLQTGRRDKQRFTIEIWNDQDGGGWICPMYIQNINHCCQEKTEKIRRYHGDYSRWWLLLVDVMWAEPIEEASAVIKGVHKSPEWERILVVDPITLNLKLQM